MVPIFRRTALPFLALVLAVPAGVQAQGIRISPSVGMYAPVRDLGEIQGPAGLVNFGKRESTLAYGLSLDIGRSDRAVGFRIGAVYAGRSEVPIDGVGCTNCQLRSTLVTASAGLVVRPLRNMPVLRPYALLGAGAKLYNFDPDTFTAGLVKDKAEFLGQIGLGAALFPDGSLSLFGELSDFINGFEFADGDGDLQHDLVFLAGISLRIGG